MSILQWNCNGLIHKLSELKILCQQFNPIAIAIQETRLKDSDTLNIPHFNIYKKNSIHIRASRGVALDELNLIVLNDGGARSPR